MSKRRVVITGIGLVSPLGCGNEGVWQKLLSNGHGISSLKDHGFEVAGVNAACFVPRKLHISTKGITTIENDPFCYHEEQVFGRLVSRELSLATQYALYASQLAVLHAGLLLPEDNSLNLDTTTSSKQQHQHSLLQLECDGLRAGAAIASGGIGSLHDIIDGSENLKLSYKKLSPYFVPKVLMNMAAGHVSMKYGLRGPVTSVATACAAGAHSIGDAFTSLRMGYADVMLAGGTEACIDNLSVAGFARMKALSTNANVAGASRPFDTHRDGFVIGEGAGVLVLEELSVALRRDAPIIAEVLGFGVSGDAHHPTHPPTDGAGAERSMRQALAQADIPVDLVGYINAHATSTPVGDAIETRAIERVFGTTPNHVSQRTQPLFVSSTKGATGHLLGAAGAVETAFTALALRDGMIPPTLNLENVSEDCKWTSPYIHHVPLVSNSYSAASGAVTTEVARENKERSPTLSIALKNSFGFGGTNVTLVLGTYDKRQQII